MADADQYSAHDYFGRLAVAAERAGADGNYAIAAALAIRHDGTEMVSFGRNTLFADGDPAGHAEMNAIRQASRILAAGDERPALVERGEHDGSLLCRPAPSNLSDAILFATLEPCPMCAVCALNAGIERVVVAVEDPPSGAMLDGRIERLGPVWEEIAAARSLEVVVCQSYDPAEAATYLPADLRDLLTDMFARSRTGLDEGLAAHGVLPLTR